MSEGAVVSPVAVTVQVIGPREVNAAKVTRGAAADHDPVPAAAPLFEFVEIPNQRLDSDPAAVQKQLLPRLDSLLPVPAADFRPALVDHQAYRPVGIDLDSVETLLLDFDRSRFQLDQNSTRILHPQNQVTLVNLQDGLFLGQLGEKDVGLSRNADHVAVPQL